MNWMIIMVIAAIAILVPAALLATFGSTRDTYQYERHYGENGFSQEVQRPDTPGNTRHQLKDFVDASGDLSEEPPVADWPSEM